MIKVKLVSIPRPMPSPPETAMFECSFPTEPNCPFVLRVAGVDGAPAEDVNVLGGRWEIEPGGTAVLVLACVRQSGIVLAGVGALNDLVVGDRR